MFNMRVGTQKKAGRGRPKLYDEEEALANAGAVFWAQGFSATSLDDLSAAMGMNRPSIYRAFGDKQAIYRRALEQFCNQLDQGFARTLMREARPEELWIARGVVGDGLQGLLAEARREGVRIRVLPAGHDDASGDPAATGARRP